MFYSQDLLCRRRGRFGVIWLLANANSHSRWHHVSGKDVAKIDIPRTCTDILLPSVPMSLRLTSNLLVGLAQALNRKANMLYSDSHSTRTRILTAPWVTNECGFNPFISASKTVASAHLITLSSCFVPEYADSFACTNINANRKMLAEFGWAGLSGCDNTFVTGLEASNSTHLSSVVNASAVPLQPSVSWKSISIPDALAGSENQAYGAPGRSSDIPELLTRRSASSLFETVSLHIPMSHGSSVGNDAMPFEHEDNGGQSADIQFDNDGNLHFVSSSPDIPHDIPLQALAHDNADKPDTPNGVSCSKDRLQMELGNSVSAAPGIQDSASHIFMEEDNRSGSYDPGLAFEIALEAAENDIIGRRTNNTAEANVGHVLKRQRLGHRQLIDIGDGSQNGTYEKRVTALWEDTCLWHKAAEPKVIAASNKHVQQQAVWRARIAAQMFATPCIRATEFLFLPGKPENPDATTLAEAGHDHDYPYGFNASSPGIIDGYASDDFLAADDHHMSAVLDVELDLEQRRGASTPAVSEEADYFNLHMDIPWLNPKVFDPLQRRQSAVSGQLSVRAESSPDPAAASRQYIASVHGTPASRVPSLDPPSSDDGLEIRSFELAAQTPDQQIDDNNVFGQGTNTPSMRGLDSFLNISQLADNRSGHADVPDMDQESLSFKRFVLDRMREHSSNKVVFDDLLLPSYRTRRVAARAFVDLLQMASKSVFHASQKQAFATINISML